MGEEMVEIKESKVKEMGERDGGGEEMGEKIGDG